MQTNITYSMVFYYVGPGGPPGGPGGPPVGPGGPPGGPGGPPLDVCSVTCGIGFLFTRTNCAPGDFSCAPIQFEPCYPGPCMPPGKLCYNGMLTYTNVFTSQKFGLIWSIDCYSV